MSSPTKSPHSPQPITTIFGGTRIGNRPLFTPAHGLERFLDILAAHGVATIDTAQSYGESENAIGLVTAGDRFSIDTKWSPPSFTEPTLAWATRDNIIASAQDSIRKLQVTQVDIFYLHRPDRQTPLAETLSAVRDVYRRGLFRRFGLSGFPATEVETLYHHCAALEGCPLPTVYQGSYNPLSRAKEDTLLPTLRRLGISFYAYGPSAGGFLGKTVAQAEDMARSDYAAYVSATCRPYVGQVRYVEALGKWNEITSREGVSGAELAYRWVACHSALGRDFGDGLIVGTSSCEQLEETLAGIERGPLSSAACAAVDEIWESVKDG